MFTRGRVACLVVGVAIGAYLVRAAGFRRVVEVVRGAGPWMPALIALELVIIACDSFAARAVLHGTSADGGSVSSRSAPLVAWIRGAALANACAVFLPAGRAAGEVARTATLAPSFGLARTAAAFARFQAFSLLGTGAASLLLAALVATLVPGAGALAPLLLGNFVVCAVLGGGIYAIARSRRIGGWVRRVVLRLLPAATPTATEPQAAGRAVALSVLGRVVQTVQLGLAVLATGGAFTLRSAVTSQGIHLVGASAGDLLPNQVGAMEAAYRFFAEPLGFASEPERALSIAIVMHGVQVSLAVLGILAAGMLPRGPVLAETAR